MFNPANQTHFSLSLDGLRHDLQVLEFSGHEGISRPYRFELELVSERAGLDLEALMHRPAFLAFTPQGQGVHGLVYGAAQGDAGKRLTRYRLTLVHTWPTSPSATTSGSSSTSRCRRSSP